MQIDRTSLEIFGLVLSIGGTVSGAIYANRRRINQLYQRLFGMESDESDEGYIIEMDKKLDELREQMSTQHREMLETVKDDGDPDDETG